MNLFSVPARFLVFAVTLIAVGAGGATAAADVCTNKELEKQPVLAEGRVMPLFVRAETVRKALDPKDTCPTLSATALYCYLSLGRIREAEALGQCSLAKIKVEHVKTWRLLGLPDGTKSVSANWVREKRNDLVETYQELEIKGEQNSGFAAEIAALLNRLSELESIERGNDWTIAMGNGAWQSIAELRAAGRADVEELLGSSSAQVTTDEASSLKWENAYESVRPFGLSVVICLSGFLFSLLAARAPKFDKLAVCAAAGLLALEVFGLLARVMISGRAPVTNMYETVLWAGLGLFFLSIVLGFKLGDRRIWAVGFAGNSVCLLMMSFASTMLDGAIKPLVPVLRDNFWLSTHVMTITFAYACFALSWIIANHSMIVWNLQSNRHVSSESLERWNQVNRLTVQIGSVFLAAGIILGGVWADYSWGRFWGWDPKETWSLIALVVYMVILHGRYVGWFRGIGFAQVTGLGFLFVLMAWFGVNYILASGLHSYGFSSGGAAFLGSVFLAQLAILGITWVRSFQFKALIMGLKR